MVEGEHAVVKERSSQAVATTETAHRGAEEPHGGSEAVDDADDAGVDGKVTQDAHLPRPIRAPSAIPARAMTPVSAVWISGSQSHIAITADVA